MANLPSPQAVGDVLSKAISHWYITLPATIFLLILTTITYRLTLHPLAAFPGPFLARISGSWRNKRYWRGSWHDDILQVHKRYGPVVRIAPSEVSVVDAESTRLLYNHGTKALKTAWYDTWQDQQNGDQLFNARDKKMHAVLRKRVSAAYSMTAMLKYEEYMQSCIDLLLQKFKKRAEAKEPVDMAVWTNHLAFDVVGTLAYGSPLGMLETETDVMNIQAMMHQVFYLFSNMGHYWGQAKFLTHPLTGKITKMLNLPDPFVTFRSWTVERIRARKAREGKSEREDMLDYFLKMKTADGGPPTELDIQSEALSIVGAGADTTSISMRACLYYLCKDSSIYHKVQREIDTHYESKKLENPISYQQTLELPWFCAVIKEAMRLFPAIPYQLLRYAPEDMIVDGKKIPAGTSVGISPIAANHDPAVWGDDADEFNPSRWFGDEEKVRFFTNQDMTFGGTGSRTCIGRNVALIELHKFLAQFLHHFDAAFVDPEKPWKVHTQWFANQSDMHMKITYRGGLKDVS